MKRRASNRACASICLFVGVHVWSRGSVRVLRGGGEGGVYAVQ